MLSPSHFGLIVSQSLRRMQRKPQGLQVFGAHMRGERVGMADLGRQCAGGLVLPGASQTTDDATISRWIFERFGQ